jgi:hypothetical protein
VSGYREVCAAVRRWQQGEEGTAESVAQLALGLADGDADRARRLLQSAADWWSRMGAYRDRNGEPIIRH